MPKRIANSALNASTIDILNVIRANASYEYQSSVPAITQASDIPEVGAVIYGTPALANQFINALVNRIAIVRVKSANFNNPYKRLKKGYLDFGETIEEIFVSIAKVVEYSAEKAEQRELKRTLPDVRSAFHIMNWRVMYPVTIQDNDLKLAFLSIDGVTDLIAKIVDSVYTAAEYDEFLLFKYLIIKGISAGNFKPVAVDDLTDSAVKFRSYSNKLEFMSTNYNPSGVKTVTPRSRQAIFMDSDYNAQFDVEVLAGAFNMEKADFIGRLHLIDDFNTFDNERFEVIRENSDGLEEVTAAELTLMSNVKAILVDEDYFQVYDNENKFTEKYVASGLYWNYFYHVWKTLSFSPFANAIVFVDASVTITPPTSITVTVTEKSVSEKAIVVNFTDNLAGLKQATPFNYVQTEALVENAIAMQPYGSLMIPISEKDTDITVVTKIGTKTYTAGSAITGDSVKVGDTITLS